MNREPKPPQTVDILPTQAAFPEEIDFLGDRAHANDTRTQVQALLEEHVARGDANIYKNTPESGEVIDTPNGNIRITVKTRFITNGKKGPEADCCEVTETIVEPVDGDVKETEICLGGYSVNTPYYYQDYIPYALTGKRFVFVNLLGGGTVDYQTRDLDAPWFGGEADLEQTYYPETGSHIAALIEQYQNDGNPITLTGESTGALVLANVLADSQYLPTPLLEKVKRVVLDAPVTTGKLPFGTWEALRTTLTALSSGQLGAVIGKEGTLGPKMLGRQMMTDMYQAHKHGYIEARRIIAEVADSCFKATGVFPQMAISMAKDPLQEVMSDDTSDENVLRRRAALREIDFNLFYRPGDKTIPARKVMAMAQRMSAVGLNVVLAPGQIHPNSHMDLPGMTPRQVWRQHGVNGRLQPLVGRPTADRPVQSGDTQGTDGPAAPEQSTAPADFKFRISD